jgi:hypothetical protein
VHVKTQEKRDQAPMRSLANYIAQHVQSHPDVAHARTLTQARIICFGKHQSLHGLAGKRLDSDAQTFWAGHGIMV